MDLKSGYPYWPVRNGLMHAFAPLQRDCRCDVLVIGGGITGALAARALVAAGLDVVVVEERDIGWGSTAASTALLQYEIDTHLTDLARRYGEPAAARIYCACAAAIDTLRDIAAEVRDVDFAMNRSLYFASSRRHRRALERECELRRRHGLAVEWLARAALREQFGIDAPGAILSALGARVDPYRFAMRLLCRLERAGARVCSRSRVERLDVGAREVRACVEGGASVRARHVVVATGYAAQRWLDSDIAANHSSYAFITDPIERAVLGPWADTLLWETARPYLYARSTGDGRLIIGGEDDRIDIPARRDARVLKKAERLRKRGQSLLGVPLRPAFAWAGTFAETADGLPFVGAHPQYGPRVLFVLAYGGNGITFSALGAELLVASIRRQRHPLAPWFGFARLDA
jgi:glycine/D-amino acid oxidase-like deaminating enzyme